MLRVDLGGAGGEGRLGIEDGRQGLVLDLDQRRRRARGPRVVGRHRGEDVADAAHLLALGHEAGPVGVQEAVPPLAGHVRGRDDGAHSGRAPRPSTCRCARPGPARARRGRGRRAAGPRAACRPRRAGCRGPGRGRRSGRAAFRRRRRRAAPASRRRARPSPSAPRPRRSACSRCSGRGGRRSHGRSRHGSGPAAGRGGAWRGARSRGCRSRTGRRRPRRTPSRRPRARAGRRPRGSAPRGPRPDRASKAQVTSGRPSISARQQPHCPCGWQPSLIDVDAAALPQRVEQRLAGRRLDRDRPAVEGEADGASHRRRPRPR